MTRRKVLLAAGIYPPDIGGPATYAEYLMDGLPKLGIEPVLAVFGPFLRYPTGLRHLLFLLALLRAARGTDGMFALDAVSVGLPTAIAGILQGRPFVLRVGGDFAWEQAVQRFGLRADLDHFPTSSHGLRTMFVRRVQSWVGCRAATVVVPDRYLCRVVQQWGVPPSRITVVHNAVDVPEADPDREGARARLKVDAPFLVSMGRLLRWKGFDTLVDVAGDLKQEYPGLRLDILGSGPEARALERKVGQAGLEGTVRLVGAKAREERLTYLRAADLFLLNSASEGMSHSIMEAMAAGTPVIATAAGGTLDLIEHGRTGWLVRPNDRQGIASAIRTLLGEPGRSRRMAIAARHAMESFGVERMVRGTTAALEGNHESARSRRR